MIWYLKVSNLKHLKWYCNFDIWHVLTTLLTKSPPPPTTSKKQAEIRKSSTSRMVKKKLTHTHMRAALLELLAYWSSFCHHLIDLSACCHQSVNEQKTTEVNSSNLRHTTNAHTHTHSTSRNHCVASYKSEHEINTLNIQILSSQCYRKKGKVDIGWDGLCVIPIICISLCLYINAWHLLF